MNDALKFVILAGMGMVAAAPLSAQQVDSLVLSPEEAIIAQLGEGRQGATIVKRGRAEWTPFDVAVARNFVTGAYAAAIGNNIVPTLSGDGIPEPPPIAPGALRIRFMLIAGRHSQLVLENGHDMALVYRARMTIDGETRATDVCIVPPNTRGTEHWPDRIERLELHDLHLIRWQPGRRVTCE